MRGGAAWREGTFASRREADRREELVLNSTNGNGTCRPVDVSGVDISGWNSGPLFPLRMAELWARYIPKGKGVFPRLVGRTLAKWMRCCMVTEHGARLAVAPSSLDTYAAIMNRKWNQHVFKTCLQYLRKEGVFYDLGANVGYMSIEMAQVFGDTISVIAFEPQPDLSRALALSARLNDFTRTSVFDVMLGDVEAPGRLFVGSHQVHASALPREKHSRIIECRVTTIDNMVERGEIPPPTVMKIDIEGAELAALRGAGRTLRASPPVIVFECDINAQRFGYTRQDIIEYLGSVGRYEFFSIAENGNLLPLGSANISGSRISDDVLAKPVDR
jgi:FkbM family methyltransferase